MKTYIDRTLRPVGWPQVVLYEKLAQHFRTHFDSPGKSIDMFQQWRFLISWHRWRCCRVISFSSNSIYFRRADPKGMLECRRQAHILDLRRYEENAMSCWWKTNNQASRCYANHCRINCIANHPVAVFFPHRELDKSVVWHCNHSWSLSWRYPTLPCLNIYLRQELHPAWLMAYRFDRMVCTIMIFWTS